MTGVCFCGCLFCFFFFFFLSLDVCKEIGMQNETPSVGQPFAFNCTFPPITFGKVNVLWYKNSRKIPVSQNVHSRIHQDHTWILFLPLAWEDSGIYKCVIEETDHCYRIHINLTVAKRSWCDNSGTSVSTLSDEYKQILHVGQDDSLMCHLHFPKSCVLDSIKWYKVKKKFLLTAWECVACDSNAISCGCDFLAERVGNGGRIPKIIYPKNNSIEVQLGSTLIVDCNITDTKENTNLRCWRVNNTLVDDYYSESKRVREGIEVPVSFQDHTFYTVNITFLEVKMEDYGLPFVCHAGVSAAYIILTLPAPDFQAYLIGGLTALTVVMLSLVGVYNVFKIDIVLWYRSTFHPNGTTEDGKLYDAYILYPKPQRDSQSHDVDTLVWKILPEVLERQCGYKLFIFGRDEFPGQAVASVIDENIKLCRRLMVIVVPESPSFSMLKNMSEEQIAVYNALIQDGMKVILIELEKIEDYAAMPESIQYIKQKHGAIQWSGGFAEQSQAATAKFWKKVRYHMPPKRWETSMGLITH
uniref:Interleukin 1 receptor like 2 n=1 Tax=Oryctolagus cuniculus TaxID=9986 RepID=G1SXT0_RABIT